MLMSHYTLACLACLPLFTVNSQFSKQANVAGACSILLNLAHIGKINLKKLWFTFCQSATKA